MAKAAKQNKNGAISKRAAVGDYFDSKTWSEAASMGAGVARDTATGAAIGAGAGAVMGGGVGLATTGPFGAVMAPGMAGVGAAGGSMIGAASSWGNAVYDIFGAPIYEYGKSLFETKPDMIEKEAKVLLASIVKNDAVTGKLPELTRINLVEKIFEALKDHSDLTYEEIVPSLIPNDNDPGQRSSLLPLVNRVNSKIAARYFQPQKPATAPAVIPTKPSAAQPQAANGSCLESAAKKLMDAGYLPATFQYNVAHPWTPEFDKGFRDYIEAASAGKAPLATNPALTWAEVAKIVGQTPDLSGACNAINSTELTAPIKTPETPAATNGTPTTPASPEAPVEVERDILADILSYMQNTKAAETVGLNLIAEPRRASILIEASGNVDNAAKVLRAKSEGLSEALKGMTLDGTITPEWVRRNKPALQQIVGAINALVSQAVKHVGKLSLLPADRAKAVEKMKSFISQAAQGIQWTKLASQRKDRIRSRVAEEMTAQDRITARRIRARESV